MAKNIVSFSDATIAQNGKTILTNVSVDVPEGSFVFLIGRTGSGKSSLIKTISADLELAGGCIITQLFCYRSLSSTVTHKDVV